MFSRSENYNNTNMGRDSQIDYKLYIAISKFQTEKPINIGAWSSEDADRARDAVRRSRESFER